MPRLLSARVAAVETAGGSTMRTINTALMSYQAKFGVWPPDLKSLGGTACDTAAPTTTASCGLEDKLAQALALPAGVGQYVYTYSVTGGAFALNADPLSTSAAKRHYFSDSSLAVKFNDTQAAAATDPTLGQ